jgi:hypothetical protein
MSSRFHPYLVQNPRAIEHLGIASRKSVQSYQRQKDTVNHRAVTLGSTSDDGVDDKVTGESDSGG